MCELIAAPLVGGEKEMLRGFLDSQRDVLLGKLDGLSDEDARREVTPTKTNLLGLLKHCAAAEYLWFCDAFDRPCAADATSRGRGSEHLIPEPTDGVEDIRALYARARSTCDTSIRDLDLEAAGTAWTGETVTMRWALVHMIEETARHAGHADIIRELIDCTIGYLPCDRRHVTCRPYALTIPLASD